VAAPKSLALPAAASALLLPVLLLPVLLLLLLPLLQQRHLLPWKGMHWLLSLLLCACVVKSSAHAPLDMLGSLLCTPPSCECFQHVLRIIPPDFGEILL
jgi:hypothetical protein